MQKDDTIQYIYTLELSSGNYYVGKTNDVARRFIQHKTGFGSAWTKKHDGAKLIDLFVSTNAFDEQMHTLKLMKIHGIDYVRGAQFSKIILDKNEIDSINDSFRAADNQCMKCGAADHFVNRCNYDRKKNAEKKVNNYVEKKVNNEPIKTDLIEKKKDNPRVEKKVNNQCTICTGSVKDFSICLPCLANKKNVKPISGYIWCVGCYKIAHVNNGDQAYCNDCVPNAPKINCKGCNKSITNYVPARKKNCYRCYLESL